MPFAARLSAELGVAQGAVQPGPLIAEEWAKNRLTSYCADEHAWFRSVAVTLKTAGSAARTTD